MNIRTCIPWLALLEGCYRDDATGMTMSNPLTQKQIAVLTITAGAILMITLGARQTWYADIALALLAALINLPIREARILRQPVTA
jgi:hypothetical protein